MTAEATRPRREQSSRRRFNGLADGDTLALGVPSARLSGGGVLQYFAWVSASNTVTVRACNIDPSSPQKTAGTGAIRVDAWKH
jgi:hypothetical protein